eukprot:g41440.t1
MTCQTGEATKQDYLCAKQHKQQVIDRNKRSHNQQIRSKLCSPATSSCEWWQTIKQLTGGGCSTNIPFINDGRGQRISAKHKTKAFAATSARSANLVTHLSLISDTVPGKVEGFSCDGQHVAAGLEGRRACSCAVIFFVLCSPVVPSITNTSLQPFRFTARDSKKQLETLDIAKATGSDNIPAIVLMACAPELAAPLLKLFQYNYNIGIYPTMWKIAQ